MAAVVSCKETSSFVCSSPQSVTSGGISISVIPAGVKGITGGAGSLTLVPNPNAGTFTIKGSVRSSADNKLEIVITDMLGQTVYRRDAKASNGLVNEQLNIAGIAPNGNYMVSVTSGDGRTVFHLVIDK